MSPQRGLLFSINATACAIVSPLGQIAQVCKTAAGVLYPKAYFKEALQLLPSPLLSPSSQVYLKTGFPNISANCWLSTTLQLINTVPDVIVRNVDHLQRNINRHLSINSVSQLVPESEDEFERRKELGALLIELLRKSKAGEIVPPQDMQNFRTSLNNIRYPSKPIPFTQIGAGVPCLEELLYILDCEPNRVVGGQGGFTSRGGHNWLKAFPVFEPEEGREHPLSLISNSPMAYNEEGVPFFPFQFIGDNAPELICLNFSCTLKISEESEFKCLVTCADGTRCTYELVAAAVYDRGHYFAYAHERNEQRSDWVKYDDRAVSLSENPFQGIGGADFCKVIYRKCE